MSEIAKLMAQLHRPEFIDEVWRSARQVMHLAEAICAGDVDFEWLREKEGDWDESLQVALDHEWPDPFARLKLLAEPSPISGTELEAAWRVYFDARDARIYDEFDEVYGCFLGHIEHRVLVHRQSESLPLCRLRDLPCDPERDRLARFAFQFGVMCARKEILGEEATEKPTLDAVPATEQSDTAGGESDVILHLPVDLTLRCAGVRTTHQIRSLDSVSAPNGGTLLGYVEGRISSEMMQAIVEGLKSVLGSTFRSVFEVLPPEPERMSDLSLEELRTYLPFVQACVSAGLNPPQSSKDTMARRISNAVILLTEADRQWSPAVGTALNVTAIEALLGKKGDQFGQSIADAAAVLLEPDPSHREKAAGFVKQMYDERSRVLHGERLESASDLCERARRLASACLYGVWYRDDFLRRLGERPSTPDELLAQIKGRRYDGLPVDGVPDLPRVRLLWAGK